MIQLPKIWIEFDPNLLIIGDNSDLFGILEYVLVDENRIILEDGSRIFDEISSLLGYSHPIVNKFYADDLVNSYYRMGYPWIGNDRRTELRGLEMILNQPLVGHFWNMVKPIEESETTYVSLFKTTRNCYDKLGERSNFVSFGLEGDFKGISRPNYSPIETCYGTVDVDILVELDRKSKRIVDTSESQDVGKLKDLCDGNSSKLIQYYDRLINSVSDPLDPHFVTENYFSQHIFDARYHQLEVNDSFDLKLNHDEVITISQPRKISVHPKLDIIIDDYISQVTFQLSENIGLNRGILNLDRDKLATILSKNDLLTDDSLDYFQELVSVWASSNPLEINDLTISPGLEETVYNSLVGGVRPSTIFRRLGREDAYSDKLDGVDYRQALADKLSLFGFDNYPDIGTEYQTKWILDAVFKWNSLRSGINDYFGDSSDEIYQETVKTILDNRSKVLVDRSQLIDFGFIDLLVERLQLPVSKLKLKPGEFLDLDKIKSSLEGQLKGSDNVIRQRIPGCYKVNRLVRDFFINESPLEYVSINYENPYYYTGLEFQTNRLIVDRNILRRSISELFGTLPPRLISGGGVRLRGIDKVKITETDVSSPLKLGELASSILTSEQLLSTILRLIKIRKISTVTEIERVCLIFGLNLSGLLNQVSLTNGMIEVRSSNFDSIRDAMVSSLNRRKYSGTIRPYDSDFPIRDVFRLLDVDWVEGYYNVKFDLSRLDSFGLRKFINRQSDNGARVYRRDPVKHIFAPLDPIHSRESGYRYRYNRYRRLNGSRSSRLVKAVPLEIDFDSFMGFDQSNELKGGKVSMDDMIRWESNRLYRRSVPEYQGVWVPYSYINNLLSGYLSQEQSQLKLNTSQIHLYLWKVYLELKQLDLAKVRQKLLRDYHSSAVLNYLDYIHGLVVTLAVKAFNILLTVLNREKIPVSRENMLSYLTSVPSHRTLPDSIHELFRKVVFSSTTSEDSLTRLNYRGSFPNNGIIEFQDDLIEVKSLTEINVNRILSSWYRWLSTRTRNLNINCIFSQHYTSLYNPIFNTDLTDSKAMPDLVATVQNYFEEVFIEGSDLSIHGESLSSIIATGLNESKTPNGEVIDVGDYYWNQSRVEQGLVSSTMRNAGDDWPSYRDFTVKFDINLFDKVLDNGSDDERLTKLANFEKLNVQGHPAIKMYYYNRLVDLYRLDQYNRLVDWLRTNMSGIDIDWKLIKCSELSQLFLDFVGKLDDSLVDQYVTRPTEVVKPDETIETEIKIDYRINPDDKYLSNPRFRKMAESLGLYQFKLDNEGDLFLHQNPYRQVGDCQVFYPADQVEQMLLIRNDLNSKVLRIHKYFKYWRTLYYVENKVDDSYYRQIVDDISTIRQSSLKIKEQIEQITRKTEEILWEYVSKEFPERDGRLLSGFLDYVQQMESGINNFSFEDYQERQNKIKYQWITDESNKSKMKMMRLATTREHRTAIRQDTYGSLEGFF